MNKQLKDFIYAFLFVDATICIITLSIADQTNAVECSNLSGWIITKIVMFYFLTVVGVCSQLCNIDDSDFNDDFFKSKPKICSHIWKLGIVAITMLVIGMVSINFFKCRSDLDTTYIYILFILSIIEFITLMVLLIWWAKVEWNKNSDSPPSPPIHEIRVEGRGAPYQVYQVEGKV